MAWRTSWPPKQSWMSTAELPGTWCGSSTAPICFGVLHNNYNLPVHGKRCYQKSTRHDNWPGLLTRFREDCNQAHTLTLRRMSPRKRTCNWMGKTSQFSKDLVPEESTRLPHGSTIRRSRNTFLWLDHHQYLNLPHRPVLRLWHLLRLRLHQRQLLQVHNQNRLRHWLVLGHQLVMSNTVDPPDQWQAPAALRWWDKSPRRLTASKSAYVALVRAVATRRSKHPAKRPVASSASRWTWAMMVLADRCANWA